MPPDFTDPFKRFSTFGRLTEDYARLQKAFAAPSYVEECRKQLAVISAVSKPALAIAEQFKALAGITESAKLAEAYASLARHDSVLAIGKAMERAVPFQVSLLDIQAKAFSEHEQTRRLMAACTINRDFAVAMGNFTATAEAMRSQFNAVRRLPLVSDTFQELFEDERAASFIRNLGFVPHADLWAYILDEDFPEGEQREQFANDFTLRVWPQLKPELTLSADHILDDRRLAAMYTQLLRAHEADLHEPAYSTSASCIERAILLGRRVLGGSPQAFWWLDEKLGPMPPYCLGDRGHHTWCVLMNNMFAHCHTDADADKNEFPNRHAAAHGIGAETASVIDSLNAVLLAHFVIKAVEAAIRFHNDTKPKTLDS